MTFQEAQKRFTELLSALPKNPKSIDNQEVLKVIEALSAIQTNCESAANFLLEKIAFICYFKPELTEKLLQYPLRPMVYVGIEQSDNVYQWVNNYLKKFSEKVVQNNQYGDISPKESITWLKNEFFKIPSDLIDKILTEELAKVIAEN